jgi:hypothetical protein
LRLESQIYELERKLKWPNIQLPTLTYYKD